MLGQQARVSISKHTFPLSRGVNHFLNLSDLQCFPPSNRHKTYLRESCWQSGGSQCRTSLAPGLLEGEGGSVTGQKQKLRKSPWGRPPSPLTLLSLYTFFNDTYSPGLSKAGFDGDFNQIIPAFIA